MAYYSSALVFLVMLGLVSWTVQFNMRERLSDDRLITIAADELASRGLGTIQYESGRDLVSRNPGCCLVFHSDHDWLTGRLFEKGESVVQIKYAISRSPVVLNYFGEFLIDITGNIVSSRGGAETANISP
ncbi:hypothetical protein [Mesorhizobium sp. M0091]|uniref:hypothetical protein n=1 Tax=Mesorhizobium sp. M0091 TaxID=2956875 RepID=UPI0033371291